MNRLVTLCCTLLLTASFTAPALAANPVAQDMKAMNKQFKAAVRADNPTDIKASLLKLRDYSVHARTLMPPDLKTQPADSPERQTYVEGMDKLLKQIDGAIALCDAGKLDEAKAVLDEINQNRHLYHKKLKV